MLIQVTLHGDHFTHMKWGAYHGPFRFYLPESCSLRWTTAEGAVPYVVVSSERELPQATKAAIVDAIEERLGAAKNGEPFRQFRWEQLPEFGHSPPIFAELARSTRLAATAI